MIEFYVEQTRETVTDTWSSAPTMADLVKQVGGRFTVLVKSSNDNLTRRVFISRLETDVELTSTEIETLLSMGFVNVQDDDAKNIPDRQ
jgi:hypothetical protein